jgi:hypothetical protein
VATPGVVSLAWSPQLAGDIETIEKVHEKALKMKTGLEGKTYEENCKRAGLETLQVRSKNLDMSHVV